MVKAKEIDYAEVEMLFGKDLRLFTIHVGLDTGTSESFITASKVTELKLWPYVTNRQRHPKWNFQYIQTLHKMFPRSKEDSADGQASWIERSRFKYVHKPLVQMLSFQKNVDELALDSLSIGPDLHAEVFRVGTLNCKYRFKDRQDPGITADTMPWRQTSLAVVRGRWVPHDWYMGRNSGLMNQSWLLCPESIDTRNDETNSQHEK